MAKGDIRLSKKYGVNATIPSCFWCGQLKNEIALMGHIGDGRKGEDFEVPMGIVLDYVPCESCEQKMNLGVTVMEASMAPTSANQPEMQKGIYPTGRWSVIKSDAADRIFGEQLNGHNKVFVDQDVYEMFAKAGES